MKERTLKGKIRIARIWHGKTTIEDFEEYTEFIKLKAIPDYQKTDGFVKLTFLRKRCRN